MQSISSFSRSGASEKANETLATSTWKVMNPCTLLDTTYEERLLSQSGLLISTYVQNTEAPFGLKESHRNFGGSNSGGKETRDAVWNKGSFPTVPEERKLLAHKTQERENPLRPKGTEGTLLLMFHSYGFHFLQSKQSKCFIPIIFNPVVFHFLLFFIPVFPIIPLFYIPLFQTGLNIFVRW